MAARRATLARVQLAADKALLKAQPALLARKWARMAASPFAFLRGASRLFAEALAREPKLLAPFPGRGLLVGDLHLENFGTFRSARGLAFHVNDFDECFEGPWAYDVLRLLTSVLLARPELGATGPQALALAEAVVDGHAAGVAGALPPRPASLDALVADASKKTPEKLLAKRLAAPGRLERDAEKAPEAPPAVARAVPGALRDWAAALPEAERPPDGALAVLDVTRRVAGTGSLGVERLLALLQGDAGAPWLVELKEVRGSWATDARPSAALVVEALRSALPEPPWRVGAARLGRTPVVAHPLAPGEDKVSAGELDRAALPEVLRFFGALAGEAHRRAATVGTRWTPAQQRALVDAAVHLAGLHDDAFLHFCRARGAPLTR